MKLSKECFFWILFISGFSANFLYAKGNENLDHHLLIESNPITVTKDIGLEQASGVTLRDGLRIYKGLGMSESDIKVIFPNGSIWQWSTDTGMGFVGTFSVVLIDFSNSKDYLPVIDNNMFCSNGVGICTDEIEIIDRKKQTRPLLFQTDDFGYDAFQFNKEKERIEVLVGEWARGEDDKLYFVGSWFFYSNGQLFPVVEKPILKRRFTDSFASERENGARPFQWLSKGKLIKCDEDPWLQHGWRKVSKQEKTDLQAKSYRFINKDGYIKINITLKSSRSSSEFEYPGNPSDYAKHKPNVIDRFGDKKSGRLYPQGYIPASFSDFEGKEVTLETLYSVANEDYVGQIGKRVVMWF